MDSINANSPDEVAHNFYSPNEAQIALLQSILQRETQDDISLTEAKEIGIQLMSLYECLARERNVPTEARSHEQL
ncbi:hypothetical protein EOL96_05755 [Candidatus Saccharibacteria bacterium]|nr:hypothetical protein [Candidatus Saccharibacteria bacterium]